MQISFVMLIFLLFSDQISGGGGAKVSEEGSCQSVEESQQYFEYANYSKHHITVKKEMNRETKVVPHQI